MNILLRAFSIIILLFASIILFFTKPFLTKNLNIPYAMYIEHIIIIILAVACFYYFLYFAEIGVPSLF